MMESKKEIKNWKQFGRIVRNQGRPLLMRLDEFPDSILVTGCQRSGTTMLSRIITNSNGMVNFQFGKDDELDAALILSGYVEHSPKGRYCFQTTYLNESYTEYYNHKNGFKIIWVLRNPFSVVYSLLYNWKRFAFNELFDGCGKHLLDDSELKKYNQYGKIAVRRIKRACLSYNGKLMQVHELKKNLGNQTVRIYEYEDIVKNKDRMLPGIYGYINLEYDSSYGDSIHPKSIDKKNKLSKNENRIIEEISLPIYEETKKLI